jgi:hypothetical protein
VSGPRNGNGLPYPVNPMTGQPLQDAQLKRLEMLRDTSFMVRTALHQLDGSTFQAEISPNFELDDHYGNRDLAIAATKLDELMLWAAKAVLSTR